MDSFFNKKESIKYTAKVNIYYQRHKKRTETDIIGETKVEYDFRNTIACSPQSWDWLENKGSINDEVSRRVWKSVKTKVGKISMGKTKRKRKKRRERKKTRREETEVGRRKEEKEKPKKRKINGIQSRSRKKMGERWYSGKDLCSYILCLPYLRL